jgi:hypothetical protein
MAEGLHIPWLKELKNTHLKIGKRPYVRQPS